jgi:hypothetical protein
MFTKIMERPEAPDVDAVSALQMVCPCFFPEFLQE